jgi:hypothetical protein
MSDPYSTISVKLKFMNKELLIENMTEKGLNETRHESGAADSEREYRRIFGIEAEILTKAEGRSSKLKMTKNSSQNNQLRRFPVTIWTKEAGCENKV